MKIWWLCNKCNFFFRLQLLLNRSWLNWFLLLVQVICCTQGQRCLLRLEKQSEPQKKGHLLCCKSTLNLSCPLAEDSYKKKCNCKLFKCFQFKGDPLILVSQHTELGLMSFNSLNLKVLHFHGFLDIYHSKTTVVLINMCYLHLVFSTMILFLSLSLCFLSLK